MSASKLELPSAAAVGLPLSDSECLLLLDADIDIIDFDADLLRSLPCGGKLESGVYGGMDSYEAQESSLLYPPSPPECKPFLAPDLQLDPCKQENFPIWLEEKMEMPPLVQEPLPHTVPQVLPQLPQPRADDTAELLREFETVYGAVELTHLTPPQSPPGPATQLLLSYAQAQVQQAPWPHNLDREMAIVDELVRHNSALLSPAPAPPASPASPSSSVDPRFYSSASPSSASSSSADEDWERPARAKPYARSTDDRRSRKKEQNKNAATRYRQKKKAEVEVLLSEEGALRQRRGELDNKCSDLQREIRYLKGLMRDLFKAKGLIK